MEQVCRRVADEWDPLTPGLIYARSSPSGVPSKTNDRQPTMPADHHSHTGCAQFHALVVSRVSAAAPVFPVTPSTSPSGEA
ncbi:MAG: hypothetical protein ACRDN8_00025 [Thermoleophilaceae bacterium]